MLTTKPPVKPLPTDKAEKAQLWSRLREGIPDIDSFIKLVPGTTVVAIAVDGVVYRNEPPIKKSQAYQFEPGELERRMAGAKAFAELKLKQKGKK